jgi:predicted TPR repeat methyltransferase
VGKLDYRGHLLVADAVRGAAKARAIGRFAAALDLGCGTGLAGEALRGDVVALSGIDLSPAMIAQARRKGLYDELVAAEALDYLTASSERRFDLVIAADVFVYMGDLTAILARAARVMRPRGLLAFTVETHAGSGVVLGEKLRFAHSPEYVRGVVAGSGFELFQLEHTSSRQEGGEPVPTLLALACLR